MKDMPAYFVHKKVPPQVYDLFLYQGRKELLTAGQMFILAGRAIERIYMVIEGNCIFLHTDIRGMGRSCGILPAGGIAGYGPSLHARPSEFSVMCLDSVMLYGVPAELFMPTCRWKTSCLISWSGP